MSVDLPIIKVGKKVLTPIEVLDEDSRGIVWAWEPPIPQANYIVACDPSYGKAGWDRSLRIDKDDQIDNCAIEVIRCGNGKRPDIQVAEYAAPLDAEDAATIVNFLGKMYAGMGDEGEARVIIEVQPGPGLLTQRRLMNDFGYSNLFMWQHLDRFEMKPTLSYGWYSTRQSREALWIRGTRHINQKKIIINSPYLIQEMRACRQDNFLSFTSRARYGWHDDRLVSFLMGIWAANEWNLESEPDEKAAIENKSLPDYQCSDIDYDSMVADWNERFNQLGE